MQRLAGIAGSVLIDDTYNANPASLAAALQVVRSDYAERPCWLVLGDMAELGPDSQALHRDAGRAAAQAGIARLYTLGNLAQLAYEATASNPAITGQAFTTLAGLLDTLRAELDAAAQGPNAPAPVVLVKGSRSMGMERVCEGVRAPC